MVAADPMTPEMDALNGLVCFQPFEHLATERVHRIGGMLESHMCLRYCWT